MDWLIGSISGDLQRRDQRQLQHNWFIGVASPTLRKMKKKRERLFKDQDILIPLEDNRKKGTFSFWSYRSKYKKRRTKISAVFLPAKISLGSKNNILIYNIDSLLDLSSK